MCRELDFFSVHAGNCQKATNETHQGTEDFVPENFPKSLLKERSVEGSAKKKKDHQARVARISPEVSLAPNFRSAKWRPALSQVRTKSQN